MSDEQRDQLRKLQDEWLDHPVVKYLIRTKGRNSNISGPDSPTFAQVQSLLHPNWGPWFRSSLEEWK